MFHFLHLPFGMPEARFASSMDLLQCLSAATGAADIDGADPDGLVSSDIAGAHVIQACGLYLLQVFHDGIWPRV